MGFAKMLIYLALGTLRPMFGLVVSLGESAFLAFDLDEIKSWTSVSKKRIETTQKTAIQIVK